MKKNGRTGKGVQRWKCPACRLSSTMPQRRRRRERTLEEFLSWLLGPSSQRAADSAGDARALRKRIAWCWRIRPRIAPPDARRHTVMADGTYMGHGWCLIIAIDGQTGEVLDRQWCAHESKAAYLALFSRLPAPDVLITDGLRGAEAACTQAWPGCLCSISCCGFSHDDFSGLGRACRPRNGLNWMVLVSPPERTGKDYDQHAPSTVYPSFAAERGIRRVDRAENTCRRSRRCVSTSRRRICRPCRR